MGWYHYGARFYDVATARWTTMDPADEFQSPYVYVGGDPVNLVDPDGMASSPTDIILQGRNGSSVTIVTDLIDVSVDVSALPGTDFGGTYSLRGDDVLLAGLDLVGTFDPSPVSDGIAASIYASKGSYLDAGLSGIGIIPVFGDVGKVARVNRHIRTVHEALGFTKRGGRYGEVRTAATDAGVRGQVHHMPANAASPLSKWKGPAIWMETGDHLRTASHPRQGSSAVAYRALQKKLIEQGRFDDAVQMDIDNIQSLFGNKYDDAILQMIDSLD